MARKKVKLAFIANDAARKATFKKRKKGLMKKVGELSTLCGIEACAIICSPFDAQPDIWPNHAGARHVLSKFKKMPEIEQGRKMMTQETFINQRILKVADQLNKLQKENSEKEMSELMFQCMAGRPLAGMNMMDLNGLAWLIDHRLKEVGKRLQHLDQQQQSIGQLEMGSSSLAVGAAAVDGVENAEHQEEAAEARVHSRLMNMVQNLNSQGNAQTAAPTFNMISQFPYFTSLLFR